MFVKTQISYLIFDSRVSKISGLIFGHRFSNQISDLFFDNHTVNNHISDLIVDSGQTSQQTGQWTDRLMDILTDRQTCVCHKSGLTCFGPEAWPIKYGLGPCNNVIVSTGPSCSSTATKSVDTYNKYCMIMWLDCVIHKMTCLCVFNDMSTPSPLCGCLGCLHMEGPFRPLSILAGGG